MEDIKDLEKILNQYEEEVKNIDKNIEDLKNSKSEYLRSIGDINRQINAIIADEWRKNAAEGKYRFIYYSDIPQDILSEWAAIEKKISDGCTGDWYDGCRGCSQRCGHRAKNEFMKMYKIKEIKYGNKS